MHTLLTALELLLFQELTMNTFLCLTCTIIYVVSLSGAIGVWAQPRETLDLLIVEPHILSLSFDCVTRHGRVRCEVVEFTVDYIVR